MRLLARGLGWPEGPAVLPDGRIAFVETYRSQVSVYSPGLEVRPLAKIGGGPNAAIVGRDGLYVTQNGGVVGPWRSEGMVQPSIQRVRTNGTVEIIATEIDGVRLQAPNDLAFGPDGALYFTDPGRLEGDTRYDPDYVFKLRPDGNGQVLAELPAVYPNGIAVDRDGRVIWAESLTRTVKRQSIDGTTETIAVFDDPAALPDGLKLATDGQILVTTTRTGGLHIVGPNGGVTGFIHVGGITTNCAFSGSTLFVTDGNHLGDTEKPRYVGALWGVSLNVGGMEVFMGEIG